MKKQFNNFTVTDTGHVFRIDGSEVLGTPVGKRGHIMMTLGGKTIYLARLVYCLFNGIEYDNFRQRIRYYGEYSNCALDNLFVVDIPKRKQSPSRKKIDIWEVRTMFCSGLAPFEISEHTGVKVPRIKNICTGFEDISLQEIAAMRKIINK